jgi:hypothetical protein
MSTGFGTVCCETNFPAADESFGSSKIEHSSDLPLPFTPVNYALSAAFRPTLFATTPPKFLAQQLAPIEQYRHSDLRNFAYNIASKNNMNPVSSTRFPPEVEAFTQSYQFAPILPAFSRIPPQSSPSDAPQLTVDHQLRSDFLSVVEDEHLSTCRTAIEDVIMDGSSSYDIQTSLGAPEPLVGLGISFGISFGKSTPGSLFSSPNQTFHTSFRRVVSPSFEAGGVAGSPSPSTTSQSITVDFSPEDQQKSGQAFNCSKLNSGFTPLNKQVRVSHSAEGDLATKTHLSTKAATPILPTTASFGPPLHFNSTHKQDFRSQISKYAQATAVLPTTASFGPPLHFNSTQKQDVQSQGSKYARATAKSLLPHSNAPGKKPAFFFLALDQQHVDFLLKELEQLNTEDLEGIEIRMINYHKGSTALQQAKLKERFSNEQKGRVARFTKANYPSNTQSKASEDQRVVTFLPLFEYQPGLEQPVIKLRVLPPPLTEFHIFKKLPTELQHRVWKLSLPGPRTVFLTSPKGRPGLEFFQPKSRPPAILQACAQSRAVALRTLKPAFENPEHLRGAYTYFDFDIDILRLISGVSIETARAVACAKNLSIVHDRERVRHVEIPFHIGHNRQQYHSLAALIILAPRRGWPGLETLTFPGCPVKCRGDEETYRMPIIEVEKSTKIESLMELISGEFAVVWEEFKDRFEKMPDSGLKVVYLAAEDTE